MKLKSIFLTILPIIIRGKKGILITAIIGYVLNWLLLNEEEKQAQNKKKNL